MAYADDLLAAAANEALDPQRRDRLHALLEANPPMREEVTQLVARLRFDPIPFFLTALVDLLDGRRSSEEEPVIAALRIALALPVCELGEAVDQSQLRWAA